MTQDGTTPTTRADILAVLDQGRRLITPDSENYPPLTPHSDLYSTGIDSVHLLQLVSWTEKRLGIDLPDEKLYTVTDVDGLCTLIADELANKRATP